MDRAVLVDFRHGAYAPSNMILSIWGEQPTEALTKLLQIEFARIRGSDAALVPVIAEPVRLAGHSIRCVQNSAASPPALLVGLGADTASDGDFYGWQLVAHILGASYNSRLQQRLRTEMQAVFTVEAAVIPVGTTSMLLRIVAQTDQLKAVREDIIEELERLVRSPVAPEELKFARALLLSRLWLDASSLRNQFYRLSLILLSRQQVRDPSEAEAFVTAFTPQSLHDLLRRTMVPAEAVTVVLSRRPELLCEAPYDPRP